MIQDRAVFEAVRDSVFLADASTGMIVDANPAAEALCGRSLAELQSFHITQLHPPEDVEWVRSSFQRATQVPGSGEATVLHKDGHRIPVEITSSHLTAPDGCRIIIGIFRDTTERSAAREALRRSEERFRQVAAIAGDFIWEVDPEGLYLYASPVVEQMLGYSPEEIVGRMRFYDLFVPENREEMMAATFGIFARRDRIRDQLNFKVRKDGRIVTLETFGVPLHDPHGKFLGYRGSDRDITERRRADAALRASENKYRALIETTDTGYSILDLEGRVTDANSEFIRLTGHQHFADILGRNVTEWTAPHDRQRNAAALSKCFEQGLVRNLEIDYVDGNGEITSIEINATVIGSGDSQQIVSLCRDITERKLVKQELVRQSEFIRAALDNIADGVAACDSAGDLALFNRAAREWHGTDALKLPADQWSSQYDLFGPDGITPLPTESVPLRRAFCGEHFHDVGLTIAAKGQPIRHIQASGRPFYDSDGRKLGAVVAFHDVTERKQAETALRESEARFRKMADTAPVMIWVSSPERQCTFVNKPWLDFTGRTLEQELGDGWADGLHPEDVERCVAIYSSAFDARLSFRMEGRVRRADGVYRWVLINGTPLWKEGEFAGFIGSCVDVSEQKMVEERLRASEARLLDAQRLAKVGSWERQIETGEVRWSDEMFRIYGLVNEAPPSVEALLRFVHPRDQTKLLEAARQVRSGTASVEIEYRMTRPDGELRFLRAMLQAVQNDHGAPVCIVGTTQDITELVKTRESLRESEERLKRAERIAHLGHWHWDIRTNRVSGSEEMYRIFGKPSDYVPSYEGFLEDLLPQDKEKLQQLIGDSLTRKVGHSMEYGVTLPNGDVRTISCIWEVLLDEERVPLQVFGTCQDITDAKRAQQREFERQKLETVGTLAGGIAHDFNNLLGGVLAQAELGVAEIAGGSYPDEQLKAIQGVAIRGSDIVRELMIYAGQENAVSGPVDVSRVVDEMLGLLRVSVSKHANLQADLGRDLPAVWGNAAQVGQIVMNLVTNASEAIGNRDGLIRVATKRVTVGSHSLDATPEGLQEGDYVELEVSDTGGGMSVETQAKVFDPFFTTKSGGHGLGLAVVQGIVRSLGGTIGLASAPGKGTTCHVLLPCVATSSVAVTGAVSPIAELPPLCREATILVVDDEDALRLPVSKLLRKTGFSVLEARDGSAALEAIREHKGLLEFLLLDVTLPGASSQEVLEEARRLRPDMKVIVTSAYSKDAAAASLHTTIEHFLRKPYRIGDLVDLVRRILW